MRRIALTLLILAPWLGVACGNGDDNGSPVPSIPADATIDSMADVVSSDAPIADQVGPDAPVADAESEAGDAAPTSDGSVEDGAVDGSLLDADAGGE